MLQRVAETVEEEVQDHGGESADEEEAEDVGYNNISAGETEKHGIVIHEGEPRREKLNNYVEDDSHAAEVQEEDQHFNSTDTNGEKLEHINGDIYEKEGEDEHPDGKTDGKNQVISKKIH